MFLSAPLPTVMDKTQEIVLVSADPSKPPTTYGCLVSKVGRVYDLKKALSQLSGVSLRRLVVGDVWSHRIYRFLDDDSSISEIRINDTVYAFEVPGFDDYRPGEAIPIQLIQQHLEKNPHHDPHYSHSREYNSEAIGLPRVIAIPKKSAVSCDVIRKQINAQVASCISADFNSTSGEPFQILTMESGGRNCAKCSYTSNCSGCSLPPGDVPFDLIVDAREANLSFALVWAKDAYEERHSKIVKDISASSTGGDDSHTSSGSKRDAVKLGDCISAFTKEEILSETDPWYCSDCKEFRQASKKFDIWRLPDILIVHLKRFSYTRLWREKISTYVDFPFEGLDVKEFVVNPKETNTIYDLYAVSNHYGGMGGGHYTAYCKNLKNGKWYTHDDSRVSPADPNEIRSDSAYVLFYRRRVPTTKLSSSGSSSSSSSSSPSLSSSSSANSSTSSSSSSSSSLKSSSSKDMST